MATARKLTLVHFDPLDATKIAIGLRFLDGQEAVGWLPAGDIGKVINSFADAANRSGKLGLAIPTTPPASATLPVLDAKSIALMEGPTGKLGVALDCGMFQIAFDLPEDALSRLLDSAREAQARRTRR